MPIVCFASPKGGVGRTTLAATVGVALHRLGWRVLAVDLDRQNALRLNFELPEDLRGIADAIEGGRDWTELAVETPAGIGLIPFGAASANAVMRLGDRIAQQPGWLRQCFNPLLDQRDLVVVVDMPPGPSAVDIEMAAVADLHVLPLLADAMSLAMLPRLQQGDFPFMTGEARGRAIGYALNQMDPRFRLCRDVLALSRDVLGDALYGIIHQDEAVAEAAACQLTVLDYAPDSVASYDIAAIARRVHDTLTAT